MKELPPILEPHAWRKFDQAQTNMLRFFYGRRSRKNTRRCCKWARQMGHWLDRIYSIPELNRQMNEE